MEKIITFIVLLLSITGNLYSKDNYNITFSQDEFTLKKSASGYYIQTDNIDYILLEDTTLPALPYLGVDILLPEGKSIGNISVSKTVEKIADDIVMAPNPIVIPTNTVSQKNIPITRYTKDIYPDKNVQFQAVNRIQSYSFASFIICPFIYNASTKELKIITSIDISFDTIDEVSEKSASSTNRRYDMIDLVSNLVINPSELSDLYADEQTPVALKSASTSYSDIEYLIITSGELIDDFIPLKAWKIQKGIKTEIISIDSIYLNYSGELSNQEKIKSCINDLYANNGLKWVLLGGDNTVVPVQGCIGKSHGNFGLIDSLIPCDLYYSCLSPYYLATWDHNENGVIGEDNGDGVSLYPSLYLARAPVRTSNHVKAFVNKTIDYEKNPQTSNYLEEMLLTGAELDNAWGGLSDAHQKSEILYSSYISPYWTGERTRFYDSGTDFSGGASYDLSSTNLQTQLNNGYHFVHMATHGGQAAWAVETGSNYSSTNAANLSNQNKSIVITIACNTNDFDDTRDSSDPCLSEAFLRNPHGGCVLYWGSSREGFGTYKQELGPSFRYNAQFFKCLFSDTEDTPYRFGAVTALAKSKYAKHIYSYSVDRWLQFSLNAIGDPELPIYTEDPSTFLDASVSQSGNDVTVKTGGITGCTIALTSVDYGRSYFDVKENDSIVVFTDVNTPFYVTITKHNYIPYQYPTDIYIQNHTFSSDAYIGARNIYVGNDVKPSSVQGDVKIESGVTVVFDPIESIIFDTGFEVKPEGEFEIIER